jgi:hypothetical protein
MPRRSRAFIEYEGKGGCDFTSQVGDLEQFGGYEHTDICEVYCGFAVALLPSERVWRITAGFKSNRSCAWSEQSEQAAFECRFRIQSEVHQTLSKPAVT